MSATRQNTSQGDPCGRAIGGTAWSVLIGALGFVAVGCGGTQGQSTPKITTGGQVSVSGLSATIEVPAGYTVVNPATWKLDIPPGQTVTLHVERTPEPERGFEAEVDARIEKINRAGEAGVERDEWLRLGDLDGRMVQAIELRTRPPGALWMVVVAAEDGMYTASAVGPATVLRLRRAEIERFLRSLRIPRAPGT